jgi:hypothetical protein
MPGSWEEVIWMREATRAVAVRAVDASAKEAMTARESTTTLVKEAEDWAALAERVSRMEAESATTLAPARGEAEGLAKMIVLLEGELAETHQA